VDGPASGASEAFAAVCDDPLDALLSKTSDLARPFRAGSPSSGLTQRQLPALHRVHFPSTSYVSGHFFLRFRLSCQAEGQHNNAEMEERKETHQVKHPFRLRFSSAPSSASSGKSKCGAGVLVFGAGGMADERERGSSVERELLRFVGGVVEGRLVRSPGSLPSLERNEAKETK
jgi:hypothetical protein